VDELLSRARQGDLEALAKLLQHPSLIATVRAVLRSFCVDASTTEDVVQELFVRMARLIAKDSFPDAGSEQELCAWVATTVRNLAIDATRRQPDLGRVVAELERIRGVNGQADGRREDLARLQDALARLTQEDQSLIVARYLRGQTFEEMATWLGTHRRDASGLVKAARDRLARELERLSGPERLRPPIPLTAPEPEPGPDDRRVMTEGGA
jgi:RNA polymerase sigma factor (sigma-70 family)